MSQRNLAGTTVGIAGAGPGGLMLSHLQNGNLRQSPAPRAPPTSPRATLKPESRGEPADECARYLDNKQSHLDYGTALGKDCPIATGIIEAYSGALFVMQHLLSPARLNE